MSVLASRTVDGGGLATGLQLNMTGWLCWMNTIGYSPRSNRFSWAHPSPRCKRHHDRFSRFCKAHSRQTDRPRYSVGNNRRHLHMYVYTAMQSNNNCICSISKSMEPVRVYRLGQVPCFYRRTEQGNFFGDIQRCHSNTDNCFNSDNSSH